jgi:hypothetical protein
MRKPRIGNPSVKETEGLTRKVSIGAVPCREIPLNVPPVEVQ